MLQATRAAKRHDAKRLQALANELAAKTVKYKELADTEPTEDYPYYCILHDREVLSNDFYYLHNKIKKLKLNINFFRCKCNVEILSLKRTLEYNALVNSSNDYDNIDF